MSIESIQPPLFPDPIGERFKRARESKGLSQQAVAQQLRLPVVVIEAIENEDWPRLGAPIYVRSYMGSYAKILGLPPELANDIARDKQTPKLQPLGGHSRTRNFLDRSAFNLASLVMTGIIVGLVVMLAMHFNTPAPIVQMLPLDPPTTTFDITAIPRRQTSTIPSNPSMSATTPAQLTPVMGSLTPSLPLTNTHQTSGELVLRFRRQSWVDITDAAGQRVEHGLIPAGVERRYSAGQAARIILGDADAVDVTLDGHLLDLMPYREANTARFTVSSKGQISPPGG